MLSCGVSSNSLIRCPVASGYVRGLTGSSGGQRSASTRPVTVVSGKQDEVITDRSRTCKPGDGLRDRGINFAFHFAFAAPTFVREKNTPDFFTGNLEPQSSVGHIKVYLFK